MKLQREARAQWSLGALSLLVATLLIASVGVGPMALSMADSLQVVVARLAGTELSVPAHVVTIVESIRIPRALLGMLVGAALAVSGAAIQGVFRNPLADPTLIGVSGGAAFAAVGSIVLGGTLLKPLHDLLGVYTLPVVAFAGGLISTLIVARIATSRFGTSVTTMLLAGIAINIVTQAGIGVFSYMADDAMLRELTFWQMGSLGGATWDNLLAVATMIICALVLILRYGKALNAFLLGESEARHLGVNVDRVKLQIIVLSALAVGAAVSVSGIIGFVGLVVPHIVRMSLGPDHRHLLPASALLGALFLLVADMLSRTLIAPAELPIGLITAIIGGPFFIGLILMQAQKGGL